MLRLGLAVCVCVLAAYAAAAEEPPFPERFIGVWTSNGDAFGGPARSMMVWAPAFEGKFTRLEYRIEMQRGEETPVFEGVAYYRTADGPEWRAFWADNSGDLHPIRAERDGEALIAHWGREGGKQGRTRYELTPAGEIVVTDWIRTAEGWRQFNQNTFIKVEAVK